MHKRLEIGVLTRTYEPLNGFYLNMIQWIRNTKCMCLIEKWGFCIKKFSHQRELLKIGFMPVTNVSMGRIGKQSSD